MKKLLFSLALTSLVAGSALATDGGKGGDKNAKKAAVAKKECSTAEKKECSTKMAAGGHSCCASKNKTASLIAPDKKDAELAVKVTDAKAEVRATAPQ